MKGIVGCRKGYIISAGANQKEETGAERIDKSPCGADCGRREAARPVPRQATQRPSAPTSQPRKNNPNAVTNVTPLHVSVGQQMFFGVEGSSA